MNQTTNPINKDLVFNALGVTEMAAMKSAPFIGYGDEKASDQAAVQAMREAFKELPIHGVIVIGEGERDKAPMLYIGEKVGKGGKEDPEVDIAVDPLEGTTICAKGGSGAISVLAMAKRDHFLHAPDVYMEKIACGPRARGLIDLDVSPEENIERVSQALGKTPSDLRVIVLDRSRHKELIKKIRKTKARIILIGDGDVSAGIFTCLENSEVDLLLGTGGAPEGVITAAALKCMGGDFVGRLFFQSEEEEKRAYKMGIQDLNKVYKRDELAQGDVLFSATGVTSGPLLKGICQHKNQVCTDSLVMSSKEKTFWKIKTTHQL